MSGSARPNNTAITAVSKRAGHAKPNHACINVLAGLNAARAGRRIHHSRYPTAIITQSAVPNAISSSWLARPNKIPIWKSTPQRVSLAMSGKSENECGPRFASLHHRSRQHQPGLASFCRFHLPSTRARHPTAVESPACRHPARRAGSQQNRVKILYAQLRRHLPIAPCPT